MSQVPENLKYIDSHEWIRVESDGTAFIGITDHAQEALGDLVFVELPEVGETVSAGEEAGVVESVKAASDIYSPLSGEIVSVNEGLEDEPEMINNDAYGDGWIYQIKFTDESELDALLSAEDYQAVIEDE
ncbi:MAG: glycine cleavage system protein GcvH [Pseudomonadota bacterium]|nr:glycine cleavage system protein GcvH [Pseudomonadota bacterium]